MTVGATLKRLILTNIRQATRNFHASSTIRAATYEGDGKTTLSVLNHNPTYGLMIDSYSRAGFRLNNGILIIGPLVIFPKSVLSWKIGGMKDITEETLSLFTVLEPKLDVLVIGYGGERRTREFDNTLLKYANKYKINMEIVPSNQACSIFNFLNAEGRFVAAGIIPPDNVSFTESEILDSAQTLKFIDSPSDLL